MRIGRSTVPGNGTIHQFVTRSGERFGVLVENAGKRRLVVYGPDHSDGSDHSDVPTHTLVLDPDEADQVAETLHSLPLVDRVSALEHQVAQLARKPS